MDTREKENETFKAAQAFEVWSALQRAQRDNPRLIHNAYFDAICEEVYHDFQQAFARLR